MSNRKLASVKYIIEHLSCLPEPRYESEVLAVEVKGALEVAREQDVSLKFDASVDSVSYQVIHCVAARICRGDNCWLEWEIDLNN